MCARVGTLRLWSLPVPTRTAPLTLLCKESVRVREGGHEGRREAIGVREVVQVRHRRV